MEEYHWLASQGVPELEALQKRRGNEEKEEEYLFPSLGHLQESHQSSLGPVPPYPPPSPPFQATSDSKDDDSLIYQYYLHQSPPSPPQGFYDIDLMKSSVGGSEYPNDQFHEEDEIHSHAAIASKNHLEVAVIEIPNEETSNSNEANGDHREIEQFSLLRIGDRVYTVTTSLVLFLQNFILSGSRLLLRSYLNIEIPAQTQEKIQEISDLSLRALNQLSTLKALGECLTESCYFAADRTRTYTKW